MIGGELKGTTEAVIGSQAIPDDPGLSFYKGIFGTNGVSKRHGFTTPDPNEALVKQRGDARARALLCAGGQPEIRHGKFGDVRGV